MIIKASERLALVLAAGLLLASPVQAATDGDDSTADSKSDNTAAPASWPFGVTIPQQSGAPVPTHAHPLRRGTYGVLREIR